MGIQFKRAFILIHLFLIYSIKVKKSHDKKYLKFENTDIPPSNTNTTKY